MQYYSPYNLLEKFNIEIESDLENVAVIKKKLLAEIELHGGFIKIAEQTYSKNDVINLTDRLTSTENDEFHLLIHKDYALKYFLENGTAGNTLIFDRNEEYATPEFLEFISPYYAPLYTKICLDYIEDGESFRNVNLILQNPIFIAPLQEEESMGKVYRKINLYREIIEEYSQQFLLDGVLKSEEDLLIPVSSRAIKILNDHDYYTSLRESYAFSLINFGVKIFNTQTNKGQNIAKEYFYVASQLKLSPEMEDLATKNYNTSIRDTEDEYESSSSGGFPWRYIWVILIIIRIIMRCSN